MTAHHPLGAAALVLCLGLVSCKEDPELVSQREKQRAEIRELEGELAILKERMEQLPADRSPELEELKKVTAENQKQISALEDEIHALELEKAEVEKEHEAYRRKYVVR